MAVSQLFVCLFVCLDFQERDSLHLVLFDEWTRFVDVLLMNKSGNLNCSQQALAKLCKARMRFIKTYQRDAQHPKNKLHGMEHVLMSAASESRSSNAPLSKRAI